MKILMFCPDWFPVSSGLAQSCYTLCKQFENHGHEVRVVVANDPDLDKKDLDVYPVDFGFRLLGRNPIVFRLFNKIKNHVEWADVVCTFSYMYEMNSRIHFYKKIGKIKKPLVHFYRGSLESDVSKHLNFHTKIAKKVYDSTCASMIFRNSDFIFSNSGPTVNLIHKKYKVSLDKIKYVKNPIDVNNFYTISSYGKMHKRVIFIGRLIENKGIKFFPNILKVIPSDFEFAVVDDGPMRNYVLELQKKYPNIRMYGKLPHSQLVELLSKSDILVLPTFAEGSPRAVIEAGACSVPSICFDVGDVPNIIIDGKTGFVIPRYDIDKFCTRLEYLIHHDKKRAEFGVAARKFTENELDWKVVYDQIESEIMRIVG